MAEVWEGRGREEGREGIIEGGKERENEGGRERKEGDRKGVGGKAGVRQKGGQRVMCGLVIIKKVVVPFCVLGLAPRDSNSSTTCSLQWSHAYIRAVQPDLSAALGSNPAACKFIK